MIYSDFKGKRISRLGLGCMRLPTLGGDYDSIDEAAAQEMVDTAMRRGVNYYDTGWGYHGGNSETVMARLLAGYERESYFLADKFPGYEMENLEKIHEIFERQLEKCGVSYFDFYLVHNVNEANIDNYLDPKYGLFEYLTAQKRSGRIRHLGFSSHGSVETTRRFLQAYGGELEFCQIQLNWLDWEFQNAREKVELIKSFGIPVWVMEPVRGGRLIRLPEQPQQQLRSVHPQWSNAEWALRFVQSIDAVALMLTGASDLAQLEENISLFEQPSTLTEEERRLLIDVAAGMTSPGTVPCTACRYCTDGCPKGLDIPKLLEISNEHSYSGTNFRVKMLLSTMPEEKHPGACIGCRACEAVCPQNIRVSEVLWGLAERLEE